MVVENLCACITSETIEYVAQSPSLRFFEVRKRERVTGIEVHFDSSPLLIRLSKTSCEGYTHLSQAKGPRNTQTL